MKHIPQALTTVDEVEASVSQSESVDGRAATERDLVARYCPGPLLLGIVPRPLRKGRS